MVFSFDRNKEEFNVYSDTDGQLLLPQKNVVIATLDLEKAQLSLFTTSGIEEIRKLQREFENLSGTTRVDSIITVSMVTTELDDIIVKKAIPENDQSLTMDYLQKLKNEIDQYPELSPYVNRDHNKLLFYIYYSYNTPAKVIQQELDQLRQSRKSSFSFDYTGKSPIIAVTESLLTKDIALFFPLLMIMVFLIFLNFRSAKAMVKSFILLLISIATGYSFIHFLGIEDSPLILLIPVFSLGLLSDYMIHYFYHRIYSPSDIKTISIRKQLIFPLSLTALSTLTGFLSLIFINGSGHVQLGSIIAVAVIITWIGVFFWIHYGEYPKKEGKLFEGFQNLQSDLFKFLFRFRIFFYLLLAAAVIWGFFQLQNLRIEPYPIEQLPENTTIKKADNLINQDFFGTLPFFIEFDTGMKNGILEKETLLEMERIHQDLNDSVVGYSLSLLTVLKRMHYYFWGSEDDLLNNPDFDDEFYPLLIEQYLLYYSSSVDPLEFESLLNSSYRYFSVKGLVYYNNVDDLNSFYTILDQIHEDLPEGWSFNVHGMVQELQDEKENLRKNWVISFLIGSSLIFITVLIFYKKLSLALLSLIPGLISMVVSFGIISMAHISIDAFSIIFVAIITGLVIDYSIHTLVALDNVNDINRIEDGFSKVIGYSGIPIFLSFATSLLSFSVLFISSFQGARNLGLLLVTSLILSFFLSLYLLPMIILPFRLNKESKK